MSALVTPRAYGGLLDVESLPSPGMPTLPDFNVKEEESFEDALESEVDDEEANDEGGDDAFLSQLQEDAAAEEADRAEWEDKELHAGDGNEAEGADGDKIAAAKREKNDSGTTVLKEA